MPGLRIMFGQWLDGAPNACFFSCDMGHVWRFFCVCKSRQLKQHGSRFKLVQASVSLPVGGSCSSFFGVLVVFEVLVMSWLEDDLKLLAIGWGCVLHAMALGWLHLQACARLGVC